MNAELATMIRRIWHARICLPHLMTEMKLLGKIAEVGVYRGAFSSVLRRDWGGELLYCIDLWPLETDFEEAKNVIVQPDKKVEFMRTSSVEAAATIPDGSLDMVYVDADHDYRNVKIDNEAWWPKVKEGGLLCGHDFVDGNWNYSSWGDYFYYGVKSAVLEFASAANRFVYVTQERMPSWLILK